MSDPKPTAVPESVMIDGVEYVRKDPAEEQLSDWAKSAIVELKMIALVAKEAEISWSLALWHRYADRHQMPFPD